MKSSGYTAFNASNRRWTLRKLAQRVTPGLLLDCLALTCYPRTDEEVDGKMDFRGPGGEGEPLTKSEVAVDDPNYNCGGSNGDDGTPLPLSSSPAPSFVAPRTGRDVCCAGKKEWEGEIIWKRVVDARSLSSEEEELFAKCRARGRRNDSAEDGTS